jgi:hypothetical protein
MVWTFQVERFDPQGNRLDLLPVELLGLAVKESINEADELELLRR